MSYENFDSLYDRINQIIELADKAPSKRRDDVFDFLFNVLTNESPENIYVAEILRLAENNISIKDFLIKKKPSSNIERTVIFVYYLEMLGIHQITAKHILACYELAGLNEPGNLTQNIRDACSSRYKYLILEQNFLHTSERGKYFCESEDDN